MAVNIAEISQVYDTLANKATVTLTTQFDAGRLKNEDFGKAMGVVISQIIQTSVQTVQEQPVKDAQIAQANAQTAISQANSTADIAIKTKQGLMIDEQINGEKEKTKLTSRQIVGYGDQLRIREAELLSNVTGMFGAGGTTLPATLESKMFSAIDAITP